MGGILGDRLGRWCYRIASSSTSIVSRVDLADKFNIPTYNKRVLSRKIPPITPIRVSRKKISTK